MDFARPVLRFDRLSRNAALCLTNVCFEVVTMFFLVMCVSLFSASVLALARMLIKGYSAGLIHRVAEPFLYAVTVVSALLALVFEV
ncbi:hypothetical protein IDM40_18840 [Nocardiopsis sp. HNM0947]|uniref:Uncharacterized protein n=1 Tax=Nocardiopsis coralli TaxID=2772213 RepID=A0ABR9PA82_9ACTN|nr:hypothetical protein [Nocardiopsis coralli]MBE3000737.1 hypothetical protein [Nocardiopsis coralli]